MSRCGGVKLINYLADSIFKLKKTLNKRRIVRSISAPADLSYFLYEVEYEVFNTIAQGFDVAEYKRVGLAQYIDLFSNLNAAIIDFCRQHADLLTEINKLCKQVIRHQVPDMQDDDLCAWLLTIIFLKSIKANTKKRKENEVEAGMLADELKNVYDEDEHWVDTPDPDDYSTLGFGLDQIVDTHYDINDAVLDVCVGAHSIETKQRGLGRAQNTKQNRIGADDTKAQFTVSAAEFKGKFENYLLLFEVYTRLFGVTLGKKTARRMVELLLQFLEINGVISCESKVIYQGGFKQYSVLIFPGDFKKILPELVITPLGSVTLWLDDTVLRYGGCTGALVPLVVQNKYSTERSSINSSAIISLDNIEHAVDLRMLNKFKAEVCLKYGVDLDDEDAASNINQIYQKQINDIKLKILEGSHEMQGLKKNLSHTIKFDFYSRLYILYRAEKKLHKNNTSKEKKKFIKTFIKVYNK